MKTLLLTLSLLLTACGNTPTAKITRCYAKANEVLILDPPCPQNYSLIANQCYELQIFCADPTPKEFKAF